MNIVLYTHQTFCVCVTGGCSRETEWVYSQLNNFIVSFGCHRKPKFQYGLPLVGNVCRHCWILCAGYRNPNNSRVRNAEACIRKGNSAPPAKQPKQPRLNDTSYARAFMVDHIFRHAQRSPSDKILYVDFGGLRLVYKNYVKELKGRRALMFSTFSREWNKVLCTGVVDRR